MIPTNRLVLHIDSIGHRNSFSQYLKELIEEVDECAKSGGDSGIKILYLFPDHLERNNLFQVQQIV
jgi:hypothetical protein